MCLVTLLIVTSALTISPAPARADNDFVIVKCQQGSNCGNLAAFAAGVASGSAVTLLTTGHAATLTVAGAAVSSAVTAAASGTIAAAGAAVGSVVAAPVLVPVAATAAVGYVGYRAWKAVNHSEPNP
jgi:phage-related tail protein